MRRAKTWARAARRLLRWLLVALACVVVLVFAAYASLQSGTVRAWAKVRIERAISAAIPGTLRIERIDVARLRKIVASGIVVDDPSGREVLRIERAVAKPAWGELVRGTLGLRSLAMHGVTATLAPGDHGRLTIVEAFTDPSRPSKPDASPLSIDLRGVTIDGKAYAELGSGPPIELRDVELRGSLQSSATTEIRLAKGQLSAYREGERLARTDDLAGVYRSGGDATSKLSGTIATANTPWLPNARVRLSVEGSPEHAVVESHVAVGGDEVELSGVYEPEASRLELCTEGVDLEALGGTLPAHRVSGCVQARVGELGAERMPVTVDVTHATLDGRALPSAHLEGTVDEAREQIEVARLDLRLGDDHARVRGTVGFDGTFDLRADATLRKFEAAGVSADRVTIRGKAKGTIEAPRFEAEAELEGLHAGGFQLARGKARAHGTRAAVEVAAKGQLASGEPLDLELHVEKRGPRYAVEGTTTLGTPAGPVSVDFGDTTYAPETGELRVGALTLRQNGREVATGQVTREGGKLEGTLRFDHMPIGELVRAFAPELAPLDGTLDGRVRIGEVVDADVRLSNVTGHGVEGASASLEAHVEGRAASLHAIVRIDGGAVEIDGYARWPRPMPVERALRVARYDVAIDLDSLELADLAAIAGGPRGAAGELDGRVALTGTLDAPNAAAELRVRDLALSGLPAPLPLATLEARADHARVDAEAALFDENGPLASALLAAKIDARALARGHVDLARTPFTVEAKLVDRPLSSLPGHLSPFPRTELRVGAFATVVHQPGRPVRARFHGGVAGDLAPLGAGKEGCEDLGVVDAQLDGELRDGRTRAELDATVSGEPGLHALLTASTPVDRWLAGRADPADATATLEGYVDALELGVLPVFCENARGVVAARFAGEGLGGPDARLTATLAAPNVRLGAEAGVSVTADVSLAAGEATAHAALRSATGGALAFEGELPFTWGGGFSPRIERGPIALHARFDHLSLEPFTPVSPLVSREAGMLDGYLDVVGTAEDPEPRGELFLSDSTMVLPGLDQRVSEIGAHVSFEPDRILLHELHGRDLDGGLEIAGHATFHGLDPVGAALRFDTDRFPLRKAGIVEAYVTSHARLRLVREADALRGSLVFDRLDVRVPEETPHDVQDLDENPDIIYVDSYPPGWSPPKREEAPANERQGDEALEPDFLPVYFHVDAEKPFWVRRDDFAVQLTAALDVAVTEEGAELTGEVKTLRGYVELIGTRFELDEGTIRFIGGHEVDPVLDVTAIANQGTTNEVRVHLTGPLSEPKLTFADRNGAEMSAGTALRCITTSQCAEAGRAASTTQGSEVEAFTQQARSALASMTAGLLTTAVRHGLGANVPQISVTTGQQLEEVTVRAGFQANQLIPHALRKFITSLYIEGFVGTQAEREVQASPSATRAAGGFLIELRHPHGVVTRARYQPPASWSLDVTWQR